MPCIEVPVLYEPCQECLTLDLQYDCGSGYILNLSGLPAEVMYILTDNQGNQLVGWTSSDGDTVEIPQDTELPGFYQLDKVYYLYFTDGVYSIEPFTYDDEEYTCVWLTLKTLEECPISTELNEPMMNMANEVLITETIC